MPVLRDGYPFVKSAQRASQLASFRLPQLPLAESHPMRGRQHRLPRRPPAAGKVLGDARHALRASDALEDADLIRYAEKLGLDAEQFGARAQGGAYAKRVRDDFRNV